MIRFVFTISALLFCLQITLSQTNGEFLQTQWTTENGLPQNSVVAIAQTPDGYLWIGTFGGLARFDGVRFKIYTTANTPQLKSNRITALTTDKEGTLWIGTERGELIRFKNRQFDVFDNGSAFNKSLVIGILPIDSDKVLIGSHECRICTVSGCEKVDIKHKTANKVVDLGIGRFVKDVEGNIWGVAFRKAFKLENGEFVEVTEIGLGINYVEPNPSGGIWISSDDSFSLFKNGKQTIIKKFDDDARYSKIVESNGKIWFRRKEELFSFDGSNLEEFSLNGYGEGNIHDFIFDREGNLWLGRIGGGLIRLLTPRLETKTFSRGSESYNSRDMAVHSIAEDNQGTVFLTSDATLNKITESEIEPVSDKDAKNLRQSNGSILFDSDGTLWLASSNGLLSFNNKKFTYHQDISWKNAQSGNSLFEDSRKNLWYGEYGNGVIVSDRKHVIARYSNRDGLAGNVVIVIKEARDGAMWFGTTTGLSRLQDGKFTNFTSENGLSNDYVRDIYEDQDGTIWIGTYGGGLNRLRDGKFSQITTKEGLFDDIVSTILVDDNDNFWMLGNRGIFSISRRMLNDFAEQKVDHIHCIAYTTADGMITSEGNGGYQNAGIRTRNGKLWFTMINGVVIIDPKQEQLPPPKPLIEEVFLNEKLIDTSQKIDINPGNESLEINYTAFNFRKPEQIRFRYRLEGLDENWTESGTRRIANYPYLPSGNFRFQVQASNADGVWSNEISEFTIEVFPPFYRTWWFYILGFLVAAAVLLSIFKYRNMRFAAERALQEEFSRKLITAQENEREKIAADIHDNLGQQLLVIKNFASFCLKKAGDSLEVLKPLEQIRETADEALDGVRTMAKLLSPYHLDKAGLTNTLRFLVKQVADSSGLQFHSEIDEIDGVFSKENELGIYRIVQEACNNIVKHANATEAKISINRTEKSVRLIISDNGNGAGRELNSIESDGIGLTGIAERAKMMNGSFSFELRENNGSILTLEVEI